MPTQEEISQFVSGATEAGYSQSEILDDVAKRTGFDVGKARKIGYGDDEILHFLSTGKYYDRRTNWLGTLARGVAGGVARGAGAVAAGAELLVPPIAATEAAALAQGEPSPIVGPTYSAIAEVPGTLGNLIMNDRYAFSYSDKSSLPPDQRPFAAAGELVGESAMFPGIAIGLAKSGLKVTAQNVFGRWFGGLLDSIRSNPWSFASTEGASIVGGATGSALATAIVPDSDLTRIGFEVVGSFYGPISPTSMAIRGGKVGYGIIKRMVGSLSPVGRKQAAGNYLHQVIAGFGEDASVLVRALEATDSMGLTQTSGMKANSPALAALERVLARESAPFDNELQRRTEKTLASLRQAADVLRNTGDPASLKLAAELRNRYFTQLIDGRMRLAEQRVANARATLDTGSQAEKIALSTQTFEALDAALTGLRQQERTLWANVPREFQVDPQNLRDALAEIRARLLPGEPLVPRNVPSPEIPQQFLRMIEGEVDEATGEVVGMEPLTSGQLIAFRSRLLEMARDARASTPLGNSTSGRLGLLAQAALEDLSTMPGHEATVARNFSNALHDRFSRTFAGTALAESSTGAQRIPPEVLLDRMMGGGGTAATVRFRDVRDAAAAGTPFAATNPLPIVSNAQERFLMMAATASRDPQTGAVNPDRLAAFIAKNEQTLDAFPHLRDTLSNAAEAERAFTNTQAMLGRATRRMAAVDSFARLLDNEHPAMAVGAVWNGRNPVHGYSSLARFATRADVRDKGQGAVKGLMASTLDYAMHKATNAKGELSYNVFRRVLMLGEGGRPPLLDVMLKNKVISADEAGRLKQIIATGRHVENASTSTAKIGDIIQAPGGLEDMLIRIAGAKAAGIATRATGRAESLIAAAAGSRYLRNVFNNVPRTRVRDLLFDAVRDPKIMAELIGAGKPPKDVMKSQAAGVIAIFKEAQQRRIYSVLWQAALVPDSQPED